MSDIGKQISEFKHRELTALGSIADLARTIVPVLRDHNAAHLATELDRRIFELDAVKGELMQFITDNFNAVLELIAKGRG